jgi:hypothetical protein
MGWKELPERGWTGVQRKTTILFVAMDVCLATGMALAGKAATNPDPPNGAVGGTIHSLRWTEGDGAISHNVIFGKRPNLADGVVIGYHLPSETCDNPNLYDLVPGITYYWRVDEVQMDGTVCIGDIWHFLPTGNLDRWLDVNPRIANAIQWENAAGFRKLPDWTAQERLDLREGYRRVDEGGSLMMIDPPENQLVLNDSDRPTTVLSSEDAWRLFLAHAIYSLHLEISHTLGWSVADYEDFELEVLFNSKYYFEWDAAHNGYNLDRTRYSSVQGRGHSLPAPPKLVYDFLVDNHLVGNCRLQTIDCVLEWSRQNLVHFVGGFTAGNVEDQWQYRGYPPVSRMLSGTPHDAYPAWGVQHRTAGCHGTNGFLIDVLRTVNIPVLYCSPEGTGHATPLFLSELQYLSHGDDPYNRLAAGDPPPYPATELLIDAAQWILWFGDAVPVAERDNNIGRRVYDLALQYLPDYLLHLYCEDLAAGRTHEASQVYGCFKRWYTVADLEAMDLWTRLAQRVAARGGCSNIP